MTIFRRKAPRGPLSETDWGAAHLGHGIQPWARPARLTLAILQGLVVWAVMAAVLGGEHPAQGGVWVPWGLAAGGAGGFWWLWRALGPWPRGFWIITGGLQWAALMIVLGYPPFEAWTGGALLWGTTWPAWWTPSPSSAPPVAGRGGE